MEGWTGDGRLCVGINNCLSKSRGGCHEIAECTVTGPGQVMQAVRIQLSCRTIFFFFITKNVIGVPVENLLHLGGSSLTLIMFFINLTQTHILVVGNSGYVSLEILNMPKIDFSFTTKYLVMPVFQLPQHLYYW